MTAGVGKSSGFKTAQELKALGERSGWVAGPVSLNDVKAMGADRLRWEELFNKDALENALALPDRIETNRENQAAWDVKKKWEGDIPASNDDKKKMTRVAQQFERAYPQWIKSEANATALWDYLKNNNLDPTKHESTVAAFEALALQGSISLSPAAISAGSENEVSGQDLLRHHNFHRLLQSQQRVSAEDRLSAKEYFELYKDTLADKRTPPLIVARQARADATAAHFAQTESTTARSGSTNVIDYPSQPHGVPPQPDKISFRKKVQSMTADEVRRECEINPGFKQSLDDLK